MATYRLLVEYEGTRYAGFQIQANARTIAGELTAATRKAVDAPVHLRGAGRTDAGVHAEGQVVAFDLDRRIDPARLREAINDLLPHDINVLEVAAVPAGFQPRTSASSRQYRYQVSTRRDAFRKRTTWWIRARLDFDLLAAEARTIAGFHDFASFTDDVAPEDTEAPSTRVKVESAAWSQEGPLWIFRIRASHFLYRMVRRLVGTMAEVGLGRERPGLVRRLLDEPRTGAAAAWTAPPSGLFLERVEYPPAALEPRRAPPQRGHRARRRP